MNAEEFQKQLDRESDLQRLRAFRPLDDTFMRVMFRDNLPLAQLVLRIITGIKDLTLTEEVAQKDLKRLSGARGICLDVHGVDDKKQQYDLEVQRSDYGARPERARYHASALDVENLDAGHEFEELPTTYIVFITENDVFKKGWALYPIERTHIDGTSFNDRQHILYVNGSYHGDDEIGKLMHDFRCSNPDDMNYDLMAEKTRYLKSDPKGVKVMCKIMEDLRTESEAHGRLMTLIELVKDGMLSIKEAAKRAGLTEAAFQQKMTAM